MQTSTPTAIDDIPNKLISGIHFDLRRRNGARIFINTGGHLGALGENNHGICVRVNVDRSKLPENIVDAQVVDVLVGGDRRIYSITPQMRDGVEVYSQQIKIERRGKWFITDSGENSLMVLLFTKTGKVLVHVIAVIAQRNEFFLFKQGTRDVQAYREGKTVKVPALLGEHTPWKLLNGRAEDVFTKLSDKLPDISKYEPVTFDLSTLGEDEVCVTWTSVRRQVSGGIRKDGKSVQLAWSQMRKTDPMEFTCLFEGDVVCVGKFAEPHGSSSMNYSGEDIYRP
jgi:hypothetical protein